MSEIMDKITPTLKSLWNVETELRRAAQNAIFMRKEDARTHLDEARRHLDEALKAMRNPQADRVTEDQGAPPAKDEHLPYGKGQREQYGEGYRYRSEDLSKGADESTEHGSAGGEHSEDTEGHPGRTPGEQKDR